MTDTPSQIFAATQDVDARALKILNERLWHFTSVGLGNCRAAQRVRREIEQHQCRSGTGVSPVNSSNRTGADARATIEQLTTGLAHLESVGLANSCAALIVRGELSRQLLIQSASLLANAGFDSNEPRDPQGRWTNENNTATNSTPNSSSQTNSTKTAEPAKGSPHKSLPPDPPVTPPPGITDDEWNCAGLAFRDYRDHSSSEEVKQKLNQHRKLNSCSDKCKPGECKYWLWQFDSEYSFYAESNGKRMLLSPKLFSDMDTNPRIVKGDIHIVSGNVDQKTGDDLPNVASKMGHSPCNCASNQTDYGQNWRPKAEEELEHQKNAVPGPDGKPADLVVVLRRVNMTQSCYCGPHLGTKQESR